MYKTDFKVYLAGPIGGLTYDDGQSWRTYVEQQFPAGIQAYTPLRGKEFLRAHGVLGTKGYSENPLATEAGVTGRDRNDVKTADCVLMNLLGTGDRVSIGTSIEVGWADAYRVPIVLVIEDEGNIHDHIILRAIPVYRTPSLDQGIALVKALLLP